MDDRIKEIDILKTFSLFLITCAHIAPSASLNPKLIYISVFQNTLGCLGVPIFFIISGYLFANNKSSLFIFIKKKFSSLIIPWLIIGSITYLGTAILNNAPILITDLFLFLVGYKSYLYFMTVLIILFILFFFTKNNRFFVIILFILSIISIFTTSLSSFSYINPLNWCLYFIIGLLIFNRRELLKYIDNTYIFTLSAIISLLLLFNITTHKLILSYWDTQIIILIITNAIVLFNISKLITNNSFFITLSSNSLFYYLIHISIAGIIVRIGNTYFQESCIYMLFKPIIVYTSVYLLIRIIKIIPYSKLFKYIIGVK